VYILPSRHAYLAVLFLGEEAENQGHQAGRCLPIYACLSADFSRCKRLQRPDNTLPLRVAYLQMACRTASQTAVRVYVNAVLGALSLCLPHYNLSAVVKTYRGHRRMQSNRARQKETTDLLNLDPAAATIHAS